MTVTPGIPSFFETVIVGVLAMLLLSLLWVLLWLLNAKAEVKRREATP